MAYPMKALEPGNLYLTMSIAHQPVGYEPFVEADTRAYLPGSEAVNSGQANAGHRARKPKEQFVWGVYYHRALRDGTTYTLRRLDPDAGLTTVSTAASNATPDAAKTTLDATPATAPATAPNATPASDVKPAFKLRRRTVRESPRLDFAVVGLVRMLASPADMAVDLTSFLDHLAPLEAALAQQTFAFAATVAFRARRHVLELQRRPTAAHQEPLPLLLAECLTFAHGQVWFALGRQLPRPILSSAWANAPLPADQRAAIAGKGRGKGPLGDDKPAAGGRRNTRARKPRGVQNPRGTR